MPSLTSQPTSVPHFYLLSLWLHLLSGKLKVLKLILTWRQQEGQGGIRLVQTLIQGKKQFSTLPHPFSTMGSSPGLNVD